MDGLFVEYVPQKIFLRNVLKFLHQHKIWNLHAGRDGKYGDNIHNSSLLPGLSLYPLSHLEDHCQAYEFWPETLFSTSRELLSLVVGITAERDPVLDLSRHYSWIVLYYGLPSASILTLELLRHAQEIGPHPRICVLFIMGIRSGPGHGNYPTCKTVEKKLSDILDQILDPQPTQPEIFDGDDSGLYSLLDWYNPDNRDFNPCYFPSKDGFPF
ncbi:hypothetical protein ARAM_001919 [Aspergillus rambellii]|uniref:Uncharacterized protein n=1 Tax=Aspergillus rambellii TaxID=308745 RepID=A0A0F8U687_9EURO|nr:hypothetical protein ARAM_001919 [Aspergillus rambellii]